MRAQSVQIELSALGATKWHEYVVRFVFGGCVTVLTGVVAHRYGPVIGGLFLAVPAIFPASATLIQKHEKRKHHNETSGHKQVGFDAEGTAFGSVGLSVFALVAWHFLPSHSAPLVLLCATFSWLLVAVLLWRVRMIFGENQS